MRNQESTSSFLNRCLSTQKIRSRPKRPQRRRHYSRHLPWPSRSPNQFNKLQGANCWLKIKIHQRMLARNLMRILYNRNKKLSRWSKWLSIGNHKSMSSRSMRNCLQNWDTLTVLKKQTPQSRRSLLFSSRLNLMSCPLLKKLMSNRWCKSQRSNLWIIKLTRKRRRPSTRNGHLLSIIRSIWSTQNERTVQILISTSTPYWQPTLCSRKRSRSRN